MSGEARWVKTVAPLLLRARLVRARWSLPRDGSGTVRSIRQAFWRTAAGDLTEAEREWVDDIEAMRDRLIRNPMEVTISDHGADAAAERGHEVAPGPRQRVLTLGQICAASKPKRWGVVLFQILRQLRPASCIELGTCLGVSAAYQAAALELNGVGRLTTVEGAGPLAELARTNLAQLGLTNVRVVPGVFREVLPGIIEEIAPIDYAFIDGHHDEGATIHYFEEVLTCAAPGAVLVFDDIRWSRGMRRAWSHIVRDGRIAQAVDLGPMGICALSDDSS